MLLNTRNVLLLITISLVISAGLCLAEEPAETNDAKTNDLEAVTKMADALLADFAAALTNYDTAAFAVLLPEDIQIAMPGDKTIVGREEIAKYAPLLLTNFGGGEMITDRVEIGIVVGRDDVARDEAYFQIVRKAGDETETIFSGAYTLYFRLVDNAWAVERLFVGEKK